MLVNEGKYRRKVGGLIIEEQNKWVRKMKQEETHGWIRFQFSISMHSLVGKEIEVDVCPLCDQFPRITVMRTISLIV